MLEAALDWIGRDRKPHVLLSGELKYLWGNAAAIASLTTKQDLELRGSVLTSPEEHEEGILANFILAGDAFSVLVLPRTGPAGALIVTSQRIDLSANHAFGVTFHRADRDYAPVFADFRAAYGLTKAEEQLVLRLLQGFDLQSVAAAQSVAMATARTHLKNIYAKLKVNSRERLFDKLARLRVI